MADRPLLAVLAGALLGACNQCPPPAPDGGTPRARDQVHHAVDRFYAALGPTQICVPRLSLEEARAERAGHYSRTFRTVAVDAETTLGPGRVATHELCHALDHQHDIRMRQDNLWTYDVPREDLEHTWTIMGEAFADTCELGPESLQLVGETCADDTKGSRAFQVLQHWLPDRVVDLGDSTLVFEPMGYWVTHMPIEKVEVTGTSERVARIDIDTGTAQRSLTVHLETSQPAPLALPSPLPASPPMPEGWFVRDHAGDGLRTLVLAGLIAPNGGRVDRMLWKDATGWQSLGCPRRLETPFFAGGELWSAWIDGDTVQWGRWVDITPIDAPSGRDRTGGKGPVERLD